ncbi:hypothetical protein PsorP6_007430 [Peronosclerospora sorghi]|uniref:Uncharacterized protein n=1 Tax=Peronosclerospora sorghi TaxID=230839 RepID=A0ACC0W7V7_9STRA|nr:hypothetical protein PsorP6_007430 [Peronosclerospora sorghi]
MHSRYGTEFGDCSPESYSEHSSSLEPHPNSTLSKFSYPANPDHDSQDVEPERIAPDQCDKHRYVSLPPALIFPYSCSHLAFAGSGLVVVLLV